MRKESLSSKITLVFLISIALVFLLFYALSSMQTQRNLESMQQRQFQAINYLFQLQKTNSVPVNLEEYFLNFGLRQVRSTNLMSAVLEKGEVVFHEASQLLTVHSIIYNNRYYLLLDNPAVRIVFENQYAKDKGEFLWFAFMLAIGALVYVYVSVMRSIAPLRKLAVTIRSFASGNMDIECKSDKKDEIGEVSNEFDNMAKKIKDLLRSRQLFLRAIMHELKTPIGKGRIVAEMVESETQKKRLVNIFERLNRLINEFAKVEQLVSKSYSINKEYHEASKIMNYAQELLMCDGNCDGVEVKIEQDIKLLVDIDLFSLAIKNLIDNALKYSNPKGVRVVFASERIVFSNTGKALDFPIEHYLEAFTTTSKNASDGMGLGLYIVQNILELHKMKLTYKYDENRHNFTVEF